MDNPLTELRRLYEIHHKQFPNHIKDWGQLINQICQDFGLENKYHANPDSVWRLINHIKSLPTPPSPPYPQSPHQPSRKNKTFPLILVTIMAIILAWFVFLSEDDKKSLSSLIGAVTNLTQKSTSITVTDGQVTPVFTDMNLAPTTQVIGGDPYSGLDSQAGGGSGEEYQLTPVAPTPIWESQVWPTTIPTPLPTALPPLIEAVAPAPSPTPFPTPDTSQRAPYGYIDECWVRFGPINQCLDNRVLTQLNVPTPEPEPQLTCGNANANQVIGEADSPMQEFFGYVQPHHLVYKDNPNTAGLDPDTMTALPVGITCALNRSAIEFCDVFNGQAFVLIMEVVKIYPNDPAYRWMARSDLQPDFDPTSCQ